MSRTKKGGRKIGCEYWSNRKPSQSTPCRITKNITHSKERMKNKDIERKELKEIYSHQDS